MVTAVATVHAVLHLIHSRDTYWGWHRYIYVASVRRWEVVQRCHKRSTTNHKTPLSLQGLAHVNTCRIAIMPCCDEGNHFAICLLQFSQSFIQSSHLRPCMRRISLISFISRISEGCKSLREESLACSCMDKRGRCFPHMRQRAQKIRAHRIPHMQNATAISGEEQPLRQSPRAHIDSSHLYKDLTWQHDGMYVCLDACR